MGQHGAAPLQGLAGRFLCRPAAVRHAGRKPGRGGPAVFSVAALPMAIVAQVALGYENTLSVTMDEMLHHAKAVVRGVKNSLVVVDLPFLSYQVSKKEALYNAGKCLQIGASAVKLEGASEDILKTIKKINPI